MTWHLQNANGVGEPQQIALSHHFGGVVVMSATVSGGKVECRFVGAVPATIHDCRIP